MSGRFRENGGGMIDGSGLRAYGSMCDGNIGRPVLVGAKLSLLKRCVYVLKKLSEFVGGSALRYLLYLPVYICSATVEFSLLLHGGM